MPQVNASYDDDLDKRHRPESIIGGDYGDTVRKRGGGDECVQSLRPVAAPARLRNDFGVALRDDPVDRESIELTLYAGQRG